jgi:4,5-DOPA dioxygenase extradiol
MNAIDDNEFSRAWEAIGASIPRPDAILCISAHWVTEGPCVTSNKHPRTIHDFYGFPRDLFMVEYPAPGSAVLAGRIQAILGSNAVDLEEKWGLDHGAWSVLFRMFPRADIPVVQLSLDGSRTPEEHFALAQKLRPLRNEGVLILGSGNIVHNLRNIDWHGDPYPWAVEFDNYIQDSIVHGDEEAFIHYERAGEAATIAVPTPEHYLPLLYVMAVKSASEPVSFFTETFTMASVSMRSVRVG